MQCDWLTDNRAVS